MREFSGKKSEIREVMKQREARFPPETLFTRKES